MNMLQTYKQMLMRSKVLLFFVNYYGSKYDANNYVKYFAIINNLVDYYLYLNSQTEFNQVYNFYMKLNNSKMSSKEKYFLFTKGLDNIPLLDIPQDIKPLI